MQFKEWGAHVEMELSNFNDRSSGNHAELRNAVLMRSAELEKLRDGIVLMESARTRVHQFGSQAVAELDVLMGAFRQELVFNRSEHTAAGEALKEELRVLTGQLQAKFLEVEAGQHQLRHPKKPRPSRQSFAIPWLESRRGS